MENTQVEVKVKKSNKIEIIKYVVIAVLVVLLCVSVSMNIGTFSTYISISSYQSYLTELKNTMYSEGFEAVYAKNNDFVAWIRCPDVQIALPVVKADSTEDEEFYFTHDFRKQSNPLGTPYQKTGTDITSTTNTVFFGQSGYTKSFFNTLTNDCIFDDFTKYLNYNENYSYKIYVQVQNISYTFSVISVYKFDSNNYTSKQINALNTADITSEEQFNQFYTNATDLSRINLGTTASYGDKFLTIVTRLSDSPNTNVAIIARRSA